MQLSVIILNYNVRYFLEQCVRSVLNAISNIDAEIIVVDNNSTDGSSQMMQELFPHIRYVDNKSNVGFPRGNNIGVSYAKGEYICVLNPDTVVSESTFTKLLSFASKQQKMGIVGCQLIDGKGQFLPESKRGIPTPWVSFSKAIGFNRIAPKSSFLNAYYAPHLDKNESGEVSVLVGAFMFMKKDLYIELGGFDESFFMYVEDTDLSYRAIKKGYKNYYKHDVVVIHYKGESTVKDVLYMQRFRKGMQIFYKKHFSESYLFDVFMRVGSFCFMFAKKNKRVKEEKFPEKVVFVSENECLLGWGKENWKCDVVMVSNLLKLQNFLNKNKDTFIEVVLDGDFLSNGDIISFMKSNTDRKRTFKIKPKGTSYLIGSNDSNDHGKIIKIDYQNFVNDYNKSEILLNL